MSAKIAPQERILSLIVALMASPYGLTKEQILSSVSGYREAREAGTAAASLERMFERDKEQLRELGVPVHTIGDSADPDDLREARYRVPKTEYVLPEDIEFTPAELAVLNLAGTVWGEESMSTDAQGALRKISALGIDVDEPILGVAPRITPREPSFPALRAANQAAAVVRFRYLTPGSATPLERRVAPLAIVEFEGRWHVYARDLDRDADRTFLLSRIVGDVTTLKEPFDPALREGAAQRALDGLEALARRNTALLTAVEGSEAALRLRRRATVGPDGLRLPYVDVNVLADELASYGPEVKVLGPADLRDAVVARLRRVAATHGRSG